MYKILSYLYVYLYIKYILASKNYRVDFGVHLQFLVTEKLMGRIIRAQLGPVSVLFAFSVSVDPPMCPTVSVFMTYVLESLCLYPNHYFLHFNESVT